MELMQKLGFLVRWRDWVALLPSSTTSSCFLDGVEGAPILHRRWLQEGDPLSPLLFILAIDPLHRLIETTSRAGLLQHMPAGAGLLRVSLYADNAVVFVNLVRDEVDRIVELLQGFDNAWRLHLNHTKSTVAPICCGDIDLQHVLLNFGVQIVSFPIHYLWLSLTLGRIKLVHLQ